MKLISIDVSPHQLRRLKKGMKIRLRKGTGFNLIVHPGTYNLMSKCFAKNRGIDVKLTKKEMEANKGLYDKQQEEWENEYHEPDEHDEENETSAYQNFWNDVNPEGRGIFSKIKRGLKKAMPILKPLAREGLKLAQPKINEKINEKLANKPILQKVANLGLKEAEKRLGRGMTRGCGVNRKRSESPPVHGLTRKIGHELAEANNALASLTKKSINGRINNHYPTYKELSQEPFAPFSRGYGIHTRPSYGIVGMGGGMVGYGHTSPALMSQPYSANYQMANFLPPHFQKYNNSMYGSGLYAGHGLFT